MSLRESSTPFSQLTFHPSFAQTLNTPRPAEIGMAEHSRTKSERVASRTENSFFDTNEAGMLLKKKKRGIAVAGHFPPSLPRLTAKKAPGGVFFTSEV